MSTKYVVTKKILFVDVIFKVEMKSVSVLLVIEQSSDTKTTVNMHVLYTLMFVRLDERFLLSYLSVICFSQWITL